jgi:hypothetical protein
MGTSGITVTCNTQNRVGAAATYVLNLKSSVARFEPRLREPLRTRLMPPSEEFRNRWWAGVAVAAACRGEVT